MLGEISSGLSIFKFIAELYRKIRPVKQVHEETIAIRFLKLFEAHGVHQNQIPSFIGHGLTIADVQTDKSLLPKLNDELLDDVCELFAIRREWLDGADDQIYPLHDFYKWPEKFAEFLDEKLVDKKGYEISGAVLATKEPKPEDSALIIIEEPIGEQGDRVIYRYHLCYNWTFAYWKSRAYLTACIAMAWKRNVCLMGRYVNQKLISQYENGSTFLEYSDFMHSALPLKGAHWHTEDLALNPEVYLNGVDEGSFGKSAALDLWLHEEEKGHMDAGFNGTYPNIRQNFEQAYRDLVAGKPVRSLIRIGN